MRKIMPAIFAFYLAATGIARGQDAPLLQPVEPGRLTLEAVSANQQLASSIAARARSATRRATVAAAR